MANPPAESFARREELAMSELHVVLGTGPVGQRTAAALVAAGKRVRATNRSGTRPEFLPAEAELVRLADASSAEQVASAIAGASVVYVCLNPTYTKWPELFPPMQAAVLSAARKVGTRLVVMENLYGLGHVTGAMTESTPLNPNSRKGEVRAQMTRDLLAASAREELEVAIGRASDYYGPGAMNSAIGLAFSRCSPASRCRWWVPSTWSTASPTSKTSAPGSQRSARTTRRSGACGTCRTLRRRRCAPRSRRRSLRPASRRRSA